jgi:molecular chaperone DnaK
VSKAIGIDLGTTFSLAARIERGSPVIIPNNEGSKLTPSVVAFLDDGARLVGETAREQASLNPDGTVFSIKRRMGGGSPVRINGREYAPEEISAMILEKLKADAERRIGERIEKAVISVPAYFNMSQRRATVDAGRLAGLDVIRLIDEPTAAALACGLESEDMHALLVWDLGGGTFDVSILELDSGVFSVKSVSGDTRLGGDDYTRRVMEYAAGEFRKNYGVDAAGDKSAAALLREAAERAKKELSFKEKSAIRVETGFTPPLEAAITRRRFEELTRDLLRRMVEPTEQALSDAGLKPKDIDRCILVGGASRMPQVRGLLKELTGKHPHTDMPADEAVALGAAIQAGVLTGEIKGSVLVDVVPISLGIETEGGIFTKIIERNTPLPVSRGRIFTNATDNQTVITVHVLQGEEPAVGQNMSIGVFELAIEPLPRGSALVEVRFDVGAGGVLRISAKDIRSDNSRQVRISRFYWNRGQEKRRMAGHFNAESAEG